MDLRDVVRSWRLMARNCSGILDWIRHYTNAIGCTGLMSSITYFLLVSFFKGTSEIGTVQFPEEVFTMRVSSLKLFLEPMIAYNVLFNLFCSLYDFKYWKHIYDKTCLGAFLTAQESQLITAFLFCLRHTLIFSGECWLCFIVWPLKQKKLLLF